jgi:hypothetical protein
VSCHSVWSSSILCQVALDVKAEDRRNGASSRGIWLRISTAGCRMKSFAIIRLAGAGAQRALADRVFDRAHAQHEEQIAANVLQPFARSEGEAAACLAWLKVRAEDLLRERWAAVETVADLILQRRGLTYQEAAAVLQDLDMRVPRHE